MMEGKVMEARVLFRTDKASRQRWLTERRLGIGGSDASVIAGFNKYRTAFDLAADKRGLLQDETVENEAMTWGHDLELVIAQKFAKQTNLAVVAWPVMLENIERPWQRANVDFFIVEGGNFERGKVTVFDDDWETLKGITAILEVKTTGIASRGNAQGWADDSVPIEYEFQGLHYTCVLGAGINHVYFAALVPPFGLQIRERTYTAAHQASLTAAEAKFWEQVQRGDSPELTGGASEELTLKALHPVSYDKQVEAGDKEASLVRKYTKLAEEIEVLEAERQLLRNQLIALAGDADTVTHNGSTLFTFKSTKDSEKVDLKALEAAHPELVAQFKKVKNGYRVLRVKDGK